MRMWQLPVFGWEWPQKPYEAQQVLAQCSTARHMEMSHELVYFVVRVRVATFWQPKMGSMRLPPHWSLISHNTPMKHAICFHLKHECLNTSRYTKLTLNAIIAAVTFSGMLSLQQQLQSKSKDHGRLWEKLTDYILSPVLVSLTLPDCTSVSVGNAVVLWWCLWKGRMATIWGIISRIEGRLLCSATCITMFRRGGSAAREVLKNTSWKMWGRMWYFSVSTCVCVCVLMVSFSSNGICILNI